MLILAGKIIFSAKYIFQKTIAVPIYEWVDGEEATENAKLVAKVRIRRKLDIPRVYLTPLPFTHVELRTRQLDK